MTNTTHYNLKKPGYLDNCDIEDINDNMDTIDGLLYGFIKKMYPVGTIYMSVNDTSPAQIFTEIPSSEWTWTRMEGKFLIGKSSTYSNDGGSASHSYTPSGSVGSHTLTTSEIPAHSHSASATLTINQAGGSHTHSINAHTHSLGSHTHTMNHSHGLNSHTHTMSAHTHGLNSHKHTIGTHTHTVTAKSKEDAIYSTGSKKVGFFPCTPGSGSDWAVLSVTTSHTNEVNGMILSATTAAGGNGDTGAASGNTASGGGGNTGAASGNTAKYEGSTGASSGTTSSTALSTLSTDTSHTHTGSVSVATGNAGGGGGHNHGFTGTAATIPTLPPYTPVYMWKRTA